MDIRIDTIRDSIADRKWQAAALGALILVCLLWIAFYLPWGTGYSSRKPSPTARQKQATQLSQKLHEAPEWKFVNIIPREASARWLVAGEVRTPADEESLRTKVAELLPGSDVDWEIAVMASK